MTEKIQRVNLCNISNYKGVDMVTRCRDCKYHTCYDIVDCKGCPMNYSSPFSVTNCHCCAYITRDELKQKKCKFYKPMF